MRLQRRDLVKISDFFGLHLASLLSIYPHIHGATREAGRFNLTLKNRTQR